MVDTQVTKPFSTSASSVSLLPVPLYHTSHQVTRSMRKADVCVGCHSPREGLDEGGAVSATEAWILGVLRSVTLCVYVSTTHEV